MYYAETECSVVQKISLQEAILICGWMCIAMMSLYSRVSIKESAQASRKPCENKSCDSSLFCILLKCFRLNSFVFGWTNIFMVCLPGGWDYCVVVGFCLIEIVKCIRVYLISSYIYLILYYYLTHPQTF